MKSDRCEWTLSFIFFFSSRRRHTRCSRDWSSDVCSSDLDLLLLHQLLETGPEPGEVARRVAVLDHDLAAVDPAGVVDGPRSEERRVGKECRFRGSPYH